MPRFFLIYTFSGNPGLGSMGFGTEITHCHLKGQMPGTADKYHLDSPKEFIVGKTPASRPAALNYIASLFLSVSFIHESPRTKRGGGVGHILGYCMPLSVRCATLQRGMQVRGRPRDDVGGNILECCMHRLDRHVKPYLSSVSTILARGTTGHYPRAVQLSN